MEESIEKILKLRFEYFLIIISGLLIVGGTWLYLNYYMGVDKPSLVIGTMVIASLGLGYVLFLISYIEMTLNYGKERT